MGSYPFLSGGGLAVDTTGAVLDANPLNSRVVRIQPVTAGSLSPSSAVVGGAGFTLTVNGSNFSSGDVVLWNGIALNTTVVSATQLQAQVPSSLLSAALRACVQVLAPSSGVTGCTYFNVTQPGALQFVPVPPCRIADTRDANGAFGGPYLAGGVARFFPVPSSSCGIQASAGAYSLNITAVPRGSLGYITVWPTSPLRDPQPTISTLNSLDGSIVANAAIVPAGMGIGISVYPSNNTDLVIDTNGYFVPPSSTTLQFYPLTPCRVLDTRNANGDFGGPSLAAGISRSFPIAASACGVPLGAAAYALNVTVVPHGSLGYISTWPTGQPQPVVSTLNSLDGTILANAAIVPAGIGGAVSFVASNPTDLVVDINGYFAAPGQGGLNYYVSAPCRLADTRNPTGSLGGPSMTAGQTRSFPLAANCGIPGAAGAYSLNMTVVPQGPLGYLTTWPTGGTQPTVSTLNALKGQIVANMALVPGGTGGAINIFVTNPADVIIDTNGYFGQ
jgi:hypothetical protein